MIQYCIKTPPQTNATRLCSIVFNAARLVIRIRPFASFAPW